MSEDMNNNLENDEIVEEVEVQMDESVTAACPSCGGNMVFNPESGTLKCPYCSAEKEVGGDNAEIVERCFESALAEGVRTWDEDDIKSIRCKNCGAEIIFNPSVQAQFCNYCGSSHITVQETEKTIPPNYLVPFGVSEKSAGEHFKKWIGNKWLAPNDLKNSYKKNRILGTYVPYWTYDSNTYSYYTAQRGDYYYVTKTRTVNGKTETYQERRTRWTPVSGNYSEFFDDVLVTASDKVNRDMIGKIEPFNLTELKGYSPNYLSGFYAERYSVPLKDGWEYGQNEIDGEIKQKITRKIGGDQVRFLNVKTQYEDITFKHILLPVWMSSFNYKSESYNFMVNGQTGSVAGEYPKSPIKIAIIIIIILAIIGGIILANYSGGDVQVAQAFMIYSLIG